MVSRMQRVCMGDVRVLSRQVSRSARSEEVIFPFRQHFFRTLKGMEVHFTPEQQAQLAQIATKAGTALCNNPPFT